jgi:hypothetical protein
MEVERNVVASDGQTYRVVIRQPRYVVYKGGDVFVTGSAPVVSGQGISEDDAAERFAVEDIEIEIRRRKGVV